MSIFGGSSFVGGGGGGAQGVIRYQVLVDSQQATQQVNNFKNSLTSVGSPVANATKNITSFNTNLKSTATGIPPLTQNLNTFNASLKTTGTGITPINQNLNRFNSTMKQTTTQFSASVSPIKQTGDAMKNYENNLKATGTTQKGLGTQVKDIASKYSTFAIGMGSTVSQVVSLGRQYRDLVDTQIAVDRTARKMSLAQEAVDKTTAKLVALQKKGVTSGTEYDNALRDQTQALAQLKIATDVHDEALEAQGDTYMNFATQVIPTAITAVGTLGSAFKDLGLKSSTFTGVLGKMKGGVGGIVSTLAGFVTQLFGVGTAGTAAGVGTTAAAGGIKAVDASSKTASLSVGGLAKALGLIAIPLAGLTFFLELKAVNEELEKRLNKTSTSIIDSSKKADKGYSDFMKNMRDETKQTHEVMSEKVPFVKELGDAIAFVTGQFPGLNQWIVKTSASMDDAVISGDMQHRSLIEIALGINKVTDAGKKGETQTKAVTEAQNNLTAAQKNYNDMVGFGTPAQVAAAKAILDKAKADLAAAKAGKISTEQVKENTKVLDPFGQGITYIGKALGLIPPVVDKTDAVLAGFGGTTEDLKKKFLGLQTTVAKPMKFPSADAAMFDMAMRHWGDTVPKTEKVLVGFGGTIDDLRKKFEALNTSKTLGSMNLQIKQVGKFPTADVNLYNKALAGWGSTAVDTTKKMNDLAAAEKAMQDTMKADQAIVSARTKTYKDLVDQLKASYDVTGKTMEQLQGYAAQQDSINKQIKGFQQDQEVGYKEVEASILGVAYAHNVNTEAMVDMVRNGENNVTQLRTMVAEAINYTAALDDMSVNQELISEGFLSGITAAEGFFNDLVKGTEQEAQFNAAVAEGAYQLGIHSEMLALSSSKAQEVIKAVWQMNQGYNEMSRTAATDTSIIKDNTVKRALQEQGMIEGAQAANDWTVDMIKSTQATKDQHGQLVVLAQQMGITNDLTGKSSEEIQTMMKAAEGDTDAIKQLADAAKQAASDFASLADAANQRLTTVLKIKIPDADKELKKMIKDLPKSAQKEIKLNLKFAGNAKAMKENFNTLLETAAQTSDKTADSIAKDMIEKIDKGFKKGGGEKAFPGLKAELEAAIASDDTPSALYKILKEYNWDGVGVNLPGSIQKDLDGVILNPTVEADENTGTQLSKDIQAQMNQNPISVPITPISLGSITSGVSNEFAKLVGAGTTQTVKILGDNTDAIKKVDQVAQRIIDLGKYHPEISLQNKNAFSSIETVAGEIDKLTKQKPQISLQNRNAMNAVGVIEDAIKNLVKLKPQISLQNRNAFNAVGAVEDQINNLGKLKPQIQVNTNAALKAIDVIAKRITSLPTGDVTVKVHYDTSAKPAGLEKSPSGGEVVGAERLSERTDIMGAESKGFVHARGTEALQVNLYNYNNDRETLRTFKRELGRQRYTMGI